jgi:hypothetical protein
MDFSLSQLLGTFDTNQTRGPTGQFWSMDYKGIVNQAAPRFVTAIFIMTIRSVGILQAAELMKGLICTL